MSQRQKKKLLIKSMIENPVLINKKKYFYCYISPIQEYMVSITYQRKTREDIIRKRISISNSINLSRIQENTNNCLDRLRNCLATKYRDFKSLANALKNTLTT